MKKGDKKWLIVLLIVVVAFALIYFLRFTGFAVREYVKQVQFYFYDENGCVLNGYVFAGGELIGKSEEGYFNLSLESYEENIMGRDLNISLFGKLGDCFNSELLFDKYWKAPEIEEEKFLGDSLYNFPTKVDINNPVKRDLIGFVMVGDVADELGEIDLKDDVFDDLSEINDYLNEKVEYVQDWEFGGENNWQTPQETLDLRRGDCEDYSTALLSLFLAYDDSLNCYNVVFTSHVTTFCKIDDYYVYYDQGKTELKEEIGGGDSGELEKLKEEYFDYYGINNSDIRVHYVFNENEFIEFNSDEEFINWQTGLNGKMIGGVFDKLEREYQGIPILFSPIEKNTRTVVLSEVKEFPYLILYVLGGLLVVSVIVWFMIKVFKGWIGY